jgi:cell wall-associated NlpC family hydrolase
MRDLRSIEIATRVAWSFHGLPYKWGGDDPMRGFDCSGFVVEILKSVGVIGRGTDYTANGLYGLFKDKGFSIAEEGMLVFWHSNSTGKIIHVEYCLDKFLAIGASGGGGSTITMQDAIEQNAYIKVRPFRSRKNIAGILDPFLV